MPTATRRLALATSLAAALAGAACSSTPHLLPDRDAKCLIPEERARVEAFFGSPYPHAFETQVLPDRASFVAFTESRWGFRAEECWMVAAGTGSVLVMIDPEAWATEACEHDATDATHVRRLVAHELVHVYHGQHNPDPEFASPDQPAWLVEGLAVYASGQFDAQRRAQAEAAARAAWPARLEDAWSGDARYAVAGAIAAWIDSTHGRPMLSTLLHTRSTPEALALLGIDETQLLGAVRAWLTPAASDAPAAAG